MKIKDFLLYFLMVIVAVETYVIIRQQNILEDFKKSVPFLLRGEKIEYFDLNDFNGSKIDASVLNNQPAALVFVFKKPCTPCDFNLKFWNKIAQVLKGKSIPIYGIMLNDYKTAFSEYERLKKKTRFDIYFPDNLELFEEKMKIGINRSLTIVYKEQKVLYTHVGDIETGIIKKIISFLRIDTSSKET